MSTLSYCTLTAYPLQAMHIPLDETENFWQNFACQMTAVARDLSHTKYVLFIPHNHSTFQHTMRNTSPCMQTRSLHWYPVYCTHAPDTSKEKLLYPINVLYSNERKDINFSPLHTNTHAHNTHTTRTHQLGRGLSSAEPNLNDLPGQHMHRQNLVSICSKTSDLGGMCMLVWRNGGCLPSVQDWHCRLHVFLGLTGYMYCVAIATTGCTH